MPVHIRPPWFLPESAVTPPSTWLSRRELMAAAAAATVTGCGSSAFAGPLPTSYDYKLPTSRITSSKYRLGSFPALVGTDEKTAASYNNFYEFSTNKSAVWKEVGTLKPTPWAVKVHGLVAKPTTFGLEDLLKMRLHDRVYRFRCVEAWSMVVPWTGLRLADLLARVEPLAGARFVRLVTSDDPEQFPGIRKQPWFSWPYHEGLTIEEATHDLSLLALGIYGHPLPNQHGAPVRLVTPWKYGYKQIKSIVEIELVDRRPPTFWNRAAPKEYDFWGNVRPDVAHPRWSQATDRVLGTAERVRTPMYNGYATEVASLYGTQNGG